MSDFEEDDEEITRTVSDPRRPDDRSHEQEDGRIYLPRYTKPGDVIAQWHPPRDMVSFEAGRVHLNVLGYWHNHKFYQLLSNYYFVDGIWFDLDEEGVRFATRAIDLAPIMHSRPFTFTRRQAAALTKAVREVVDDEHEYSNAKAPFLYRD